MTHIKRIDEYNKSLYSEEKKIEKALDSYCSYNGMTRDPDTGRDYPNHMGMVLDECGFECDWSIRPKYYEVNVKGYPVEYIEILWITQDNINDSTSVKCLKDMFLGALELSDIGHGNLSKIDYEIKFICGCRDNFDAENPKYRWKLVINGSQYEIVDDNE